MRVHGMSTGFVALLVCSVAMAGAASDDERAPEFNEALKAYQALQEAVDWVEVTHAPETNVVAPEALVPLFGHRRPRIGIIVRTSGFGDEPVGAVVEGVTPGGPADEAGLEVGDVITRVDGRSLVGNETGSAAKAMAGYELVNWSRGLEDGQTVTIDFTRDGTPATATIVAREIESVPAAEYFSQAFGGRVPAPDGTRFIVEPPHWVFPSAWLDMELVALNPELGEYFASDRGVLVVRAPQDDSLGLESGDVILAIGGRDVRDPSHAMRILRSYEPDEELSIDIVRHGRSQTLVGTVPESNVELFGRAPRAPGVDD